MPDRPCFHAGCTSGYNSQKYTPAHIFKIPTTATEQVRKCWMKNIPKQVHRVFDLEKDRLCSLHFEEKYIVKQLYILYNGEKVPQGDRKHWVLTNDAIPTKFSNEKTKFEMPKTNIRSTKKTSVKSYGTTMKRSTTNKNLKDKCKPINGQSKHSKKNKNNTEIVTTPQISAFKPLVSLVINGWISPEPVTSIIDLLKWLDTCGTLTVTENDADLIRSQICRYFTGCNKAQTRKIQVPPETNNVQNSRPKRSTPSKYRKTYGARVCTNRASINRNRGFQNAGKLCNIEDESLTTEIKVEEEEDLNVNFEAADETSFCPTIKKEVESEGEGDSDREEQAEEFHKTIRILNTTGKYSAKPKGKIEYDPPISLALKKQPNPKVYAANVKRRQHESQQSTHSKIMGQENPQIQTPCSSGNLSTKITGWFGSKSLYPTEPRRIGSHMPAQPKQTIEKHKNLEKAPQSSGQILHSGSKAVETGSDRFRAVLLQMRMGVADLPLTDEVESLPRGIENPRLPAHDPTITHAEPLPLSFYRETIHKNLNWRTRKMSLNFECSECGVILRTKRSLKLHMDNHLNLRNFLCHTCGKSFNSKDGLIRHNSSHNLGEQNYLCQTCGKTFSSLPGLIRHNSRHYPGERNYVCDKCAKTFRSSTGLVNHQRIHDRVVTHLKIQSPGHFNIPKNSKGFKCTICPKAFRTASFLARHTVRHHGQNQFNVPMDSKEKPFKCTICLKAFRTPGVLARHTALHSQDQFNTDSRGKPFKCRICLKGFRTPGFLARHTVLHTGIKRFKCESCGQFFLKKRGLSIHIRTYHR